jgi:hypothetical protein
LETSDAYVKVLDIGIVVYMKSNSYASADLRFENLIRPYISFYSREHMISFLQGCEECYNGQATARGRAYHDHKEIKECIDTKYTDIILDDYPRFLKSVSDR